MIFLPALIALVVSLATVPLSIWIARRWGTLDLADARKVHIAPTPRLGGLAIVAGVVCGVGGTVGYLRYTGSALNPELLRPMLAICVAGLFVFLVGLVDDIRSVSSRFKLIALIGAAATVCGGGTVIGDVVLAGKSVVSFHAVSWFVTILWIVGVAVAINFIDGLDGLAGGLTLMSAVVVGLFMVMMGQGSQAIIPLALCGSLAGFLVYNWHPAKTFMGDCGSMTIGVLLASSIAIANPAVGTMRGLILPTLAISVPIVDAIFTIFRRRYLQRRSMFSAERGHIHHRLLDRGLSHPQAVLAIYAVSAMAVGIGLLSLSFSGWATVGGLALLFPLFWGSMQLAGSVRTNEMVEALRTKREIDRTAKRYRATFEDMQLEFHHVRNFSQWWEGVCRAAERLDFVQVTLRLPTNGNHDWISREREMSWKTENVRLTLCERMKASLPITMSNHDGPTATISLDVAATNTMESAGERLALFARLLTENSIAGLRRKERETRSNSRGRSPLGQHPNGIAAGWSREPDAEGNFDPGPFVNLRVAIVHDFLYTYCGAERVLEQLINVFPHCELFALFDFLPESQREFLQGKPVTTSFIQRMPLARKKHRAYLPLMPFAIEQLDVSNYDLVSAVPILPPRASSRGLTNCMFRIATAPFVTLGICITNT